MVGKSAAPLLGHRSLRKQWAKRTASGKQELKKEGPCRSNAIPAKKPTNAHSASGSATATTSLRKCWISGTVLKIPTLRSEQTTAICISSGTGSRQSKTTGTSNRSGNSVIEAAANSAPFVRVWRTAFVVEPTFELV